MMTESDQDLLLPVNALRVAQKNAILQTLPADEVAFILGPWADQGRQFALDTYELLKPEIFRRDYGSELTALDVGAGPGFGTELLAGIFAGKGSPYLIDFTALELSDRLSCVYANFHSHTNLIAQNLYDLEDGAYDFVLCSHVIEHLDRDEVPRFIAKMRSVSRNAVIVTTPWQEGGNRHPEHRYSVDMDLIEEVKPSDWKIFRSFGWNNPQGTSRCLGMVFRK